MLFPGLRRLRESERRYPGSPRAMKKFPERRGEADVRRRPRLDLRRRLEVRGRLRGTDGTHSRFNSQIHMNDIA